MRRSSVTRFGLALLLASTAGAASAAAATVRDGPGPSGSIAASAPPTGEHPERAGLKPGTVIVDRAGRKIGVIVATGFIDHGGSAVRIDDNGSRFDVGVGWLRLSRRGDKAVLLLSRSRLRTRAILNAG